MALEIRWVISKESPKFGDRVLRGFFWILGFTLGAFCAASAQQEPDLQQQLQQLKAQYQQSTHDLEQRIATLEQQIKEEKETQEKTKENTVSAVELAAQQTEKAVLGQSKEVGAKFQGQLPSAPTYDFLRDTDTKIEKLQQQVGTFEFHGYFRSGYGLNSVGGQQVAFEAPGAKVLQGISPATLNAVLAPLDTQPLCFQLVSNSVVRARPFYGYRAGDRYFVYLDPRMGARISHRDVKFTGKWNDAGVFRFSNEVGATAECGFEGTGVRWLGRRFDDAGQAEITIDGQVVGAADQYGPGRDLPFDWTHRGLAPGKHTIRLRLLPDKVEKSTDRFLNVAGFETLTEQP